MARLRPSAAARWVPCPGSVTLCEKYPEKEGDNAPALEGQAAHWVAAEMLTATLSDDRHRLEVWTSYFRGARAPNGVVVTQDMLSFALVYLKDVARVLQGRDWSELKVEHTVDVPSVHPENSGTLDSAVADLDGTTLTVWDYKYGWGVVEPHGNWQLLDYARGMLDLLGKRVEFVDLRVVQPRPHHPLGPVRSWKVPVSGLAPYLQKMQGAAIEAFSNSPSYNPGVPQCNHCSGRGHCTAASRAAYHIQEFVDHSPPVELDNEALGARVYQLRKYSKLLAALTAVAEEHALFRIKEGGVIPGWEAQRARGGKRWKKGTEGELLALAELLSVDIRKPAALITPNQAEKAGIDNAVISAYSERTPGALKLLALDGKKVEQSFNN